MWYIIEIIYILFFSMIKAILQLAECGTFLGQVDLFKVRGKFAFTDAYEDHFLLPKGKILLVTHHRILLLQVCTCICTSLIVVWINIPFPCSKIM